MPLTSVSYLIDVADVARKCPFTPRVTKARCRARPSSQLRSVFAKLDINSRLALAHIAVEHDPEG
jgi:hypothetical protein